MNKKEILKWIDELKEQLCNSNCENQENYECFNCICINSLKDKIEVKE